MITRDTIEKIYAAVDIADVIGDFVNLKKRGANFVGLSPFSNEKTPSFYVSPAKGIFKDFSSGIGGDAVKFVMEHEKSSYPEALRYLAKKYHIEIVEDGINEDAMKAKQEQDLRESLFNANQFAKKFFQEQLLNTDEGLSVGLSYFNERGLSPETIKKFELGYSPESKVAFTSHALENGYKLDILIQSGLTKANEDRSWKVDAYNGRVIFPIHNLTGRTVGFSARILGNNKETAKYLNTADTEVFNKSKILFGLHLAKKTIVKEDAVYLVEGQMDVISMFEVGLENTVASSGTSLTEDQIRQIKKFTNTIVLLYDGDAAGIKAANRAIDMILAEGMNVKAVLFPNAEDPDSYSKKIGRESFIEFVNKQSKNFIDFRYQQIRNEVEADPIKKVEYLKDVMQSVSIIPNAINRAVYITECSKIWDIGEQSLISELNKLLKKKIGKTSTENSTTEIPEIIAVPEKQEEEIKELLTQSMHFQERDLLRLMIKFGTRALSFDVYNEDDREKENIEIALSELVIFELQEEGLVFRDPIHLKIFETIKNKIVNEGMVPSEDFFIHHPDEEVQKFAIDVVMGGYKLSDAWEKRFNNTVLGEEHKLKEAVRGALFTYKMKIINELRNDLLIQIKNAVDEEEIIKLQHKKMQLDYTIKNLTAYYKPVI